MSRIGNPWHLAAIGLGPSRAGVPTGRGVVVAVLDTGIDGTHTDFASSRQRLCQYGFDIHDNLVPLSPGRDHDWWGHGTHSAGVIGSSDSDVGVAPDVDLIGIVFAHRPRTGHTGRSVEYSRLVLALESVARGFATVSVVNLSAGLPYPLDPALHALIQRILAWGIFPIVAAGNHTHRDQPPACPGDCPDALTVGSSNRQRQVSTFSRNGTVTPASGPCYTKPDLVAPGEEVYTTEKGGGHSFRSGTSLAAAIVSGVAALVLEVNPVLDLPTLRQVLLDSCLLLNEPRQRQGSGLVQVPAALKDARGPTSHSSGN